MEDDPPNKRVHICTAIVSRGERRNSGLVGFIWLRMAAPPPSSSEPVANRRPPMLAGVHHVHHDRSAADATSRTMTTTRTRAAMAATVAVLALVAALSAVGKTSPQPISAPPSGRIRRRELSSRRSLFSFDPRTTEAREPGSSGGIMPPPPAGSDSLPTVQIYVKASGNSPYLERSARLMRECTSTAPEGRVTFMFDNNNAEEVDRLGLEFPNVEINHVDGTDNQVRRAGRVQEQVHGPCFSL